MLLYLKDIYARRQNKNESEKENLKVTASVKVVFEQEMFRIQLPRRRGIPIRIGHVQAKAKCSDVRLQTELNDCQNKQLQDLFS